MSGLSARGSSEAGVSLSSHGATLLYGAAALASIAAFVIFAAWHLSSTGFWYDESMQFWMSLGIDGFGPPHVPRAGVVATLRANIVANLDPGGFTMLLHFWLVFSTAEIWQRVLPLLFMVVAMAGLAWIGWSHRNSLLFAMLCSVVPALFPLMLDYATEVRAYSMEIAGVVVGYALIERLAARPDMRLAFATGTLFGLFLGSRYSFALFSAAAFLGLTYAFARQGRQALVNKSPYLLGFVLPLAVCAAMIFFLALWPQYRGRMSFDGGSLVQYLAAMTAAGKSLNEIGALLAVNLLHPLALPLTFGALVGVAAMLPGAASSRLGKIRFAIDRLDLGVLGVTCLASLVISAVLWRWHPWLFNSKWSLWMQALSAVAIVRFAAAAVTAFAKPQPSGLGEPRLIAAVMLIGLLALDLRFALYRRQNWPTFVPALAYLEKLSPSAGSVSIDVHSYPTIRYFYEYGSFAASKLFPDVFRMPHWTAPKPLVTDQTRFLLTGLSVADANRYLAPGRIVEDPALPPRLFRVEPAR